MIGDGKMNSNLEGPKSPGNDGPMECEAARDQFALLLYGELSFDEEERVESHLEACPACRKALEQQKALHAAIDAVEVTPSPALLASCREDLSEWLRSETAARGARPEDSGSGWWAQFLESFKGPWKSSPEAQGAWGGWLRPIGALTLIAVGFFGARLAPVLNVGNPAIVAGDMGMLGSQVRNVETQPDGKVRIVLDQTQQRTIDGTINDQAIRSLLVSAAKEASDPSLRAATVQILIADTNAPDVRRALVFAIEHDQNAEVRLRAMQGLKPHAEDPDVQTALADVLLRDVNPGLRTQAIDLLTAREDQEMNRQMIGVFQELMSRENDGYVRERCQRALKLVNASAGIY